MRNLNYIGSKNKLINFIEKVVELNNSKNQKEKLIFGDLFAGTGIVGQNFSNKFNIVSNDAEYYSYIINYSILKSRYSTKLKNIINDLNNLTELKEGLISKHYSVLGEKKRNFFSPDNAKKADTIREKINKMFEEKKITKKEKIFLIGSLLVSIDRVANTTSVYGAYLKKLKASALKPLILEPIHKKKKINKNNKVYNKDIIDLDSEYDIVYLDPPYNNRQYSANYAPLNFIAKYDETIIPYGKTGLLENYFKSDFCSKAKAKETMEKLINQLKTKMLLISYNNEGIISEDDFKDMLKKIGKVTIYKSKYKKYKSRKEDDNQTVMEYIYFVEKKQEIKKEESNVVTI